MSFESKSDKTKGHAKEAAGDLTDDPDLKREGKADRASGTAKEKVQQAKEKATDAVDAARDKLKGQ